MQVCLAAPVKKDEAIWGLSQDFAMLSHSSNLSDTPHVWVELGAIDMPTIGWCVLWQLWCCDMCCNMCCNWHMRHVLFLAL